MTKRSEKFEPTKSRKWENSNIKVIKAWTMMISKVIFQLKNVQFSLYEAVMKFYDFFINQNLREIDFGVPRSAKSTILTHFEVLNCDFLNLCTFWRLKFINLKNSKPLKL